MTWWQRVLLGLLLLTHWVLVWGLVASLASLGAGSELQACATLGLLLGQGVLASLWLICVRGSRWWRSLCVLLMVAYAWLAITLGLDASERWSLTDLFLVGLAIVVGMLTFSSVLGLACWIGRWEIRSPGDDDRSSNRQISLRRGLAIMAIACVFLAVVRQFMPPMEGSAWADFANLKRELPMLLLGFAIASAVLAVNCCTMLPVIAIMFCLEGPRRQSIIGVIFLGVPVYGAVVSLLESLFLLTWMVGNDPIPASILLAINTVQLFTIVVSLMLLRLIGFRFERAPRRGELPPGEGGERLQDAGAASTMAAANETSPLAIDR